ncbi:MAG: hypothetical protein ACI90U_000195 [Pseudomonadales bacterium]|jgi:hypothetical protein
MDISIGQTAILTPVLAMLLLAFVVWIVLFITRLKAIGELKIKPDAINTPDAVDSLLPNYARYPGHNFKNLFEVPVLFYIMCFYLYATGTADSVAINCAWAFVGLRVLHSIVQCSYNNVNHRFAAYFFSCIALWVMVLRSAMDLF